MKKRRVKRGIKKACLYILIITMILLSYNKIIQRQQEEHKKTLENYKTCIIEQSNKQGYIIRSYCSNNWRILDQETKAEYKQIKKDIYFIKFGE